MIALAIVKKVIIPIMIAGVPVESHAKSNEETTPLPYWSEPINAEAEPAISGTPSKAAAVELAATVPFIEKKKNTMIMTL